MFQQLIIASRSFALVVVAVVFLGTALPGHADNTETLDPPENYELWYGIFMDGERVGHLSQELTASGEGEERSYRHTTHKQMKLRVDDRKLLIESRTVLHFDPEPPYRLQRAEQTFEREGKRRTVVLSNSGEEYDVEVKVDGTSRVLNKVELDYSLSHLLATRNWIRSRPLLGDTIDSAELDLEHLAVSRVKQTVLRKGSENAQADSTAQFEIGVRSFSRGDIGVAHVGADGIARAFDFGGKFALKLEPAEEAHKASFTKDLRKELLAPVDRALGNPDRIRRISLEVRGDGAERLSQMLDRDIQWSRERGNLVFTNVQRTPKFTGTDPDEMQSSLAETVQYPIRHHVIRTVASRVIEGSSTQIEAVKRLVAFVNKAVRSTNTSDSLDVIDVLRHRRGTCKDRARLFTSLARSVGLPSREVAGIMYAGDAEKNFSAHSWNEVFLDGRWIAVDPTYNRFNVNPTYVSFGSGEKGTVGLTRILGQFSFRVVDIAYAS